jgi:hypothetical protein
VELGLGQGDSRNVIIWTSKDLTVNRVYASWAPQLRSWGKVKISYTTRHETPLVWILYLRYPLETGLDKGETKAVSSPHIYVRPQRDKRAGSSSECYVEVVPGSAGIIDVRGHSTYSTVARAYSPAASLFTVVTVQEGNTAGTVHSVLRG